MALESFLIFHEYISFEIKCAAAISFYFTSTIIAYIGDRFFAWEWEYTVIFLIVLILFGTTVRLVRNSIHRIAGILSAKIL